MKLTRKQRDRYRLVREISRLEFQALRQLMTAKGHRWNGYDWVPR